MAYLVLIGSGGWTEKWEIAPGEDDTVARELAQMGSDGTSHLPLLNPGTDEQIDLVVAWRAVAAASVVPSVRAPLPGQYA
ncbi:MAG: hypothetical protein QOC93_1800 [Actinomycetota bacterium]|jgi:hypothetical protein|nr:hypothetical protein [Cryptosporangiaceae bacterium]MDQ1676656.1 hypothetical protein [Actinomycetota bacterium]